jgi:hypothetical protein
MTDHSPMAGQTNGNDSRKCRLMLNSSVNLHYALFGLSLCVCSEVHRHIVRLSTYLGASLLHSAISKDEYTGFTRVFNDTVSVGLYFEGTL